MICFLKNCLFCIFFWLADSNVWNEVIGNERVRRNIQRVHPTGLSFPVITLRKWEFSRRTDIRNVLSSVASIDKGTRGSAGRKCHHTASKPLRIHKVFSAVFSLSASISAPAELLRIGQPWFFEGFLFFWTQAGCRPPRTKGQKAPKGLAVRRVCSC